MNKEKTVSLRLLLLLLAVVCVLGMMPATAFGLTDGEVEAGNTCHIIPKGTASISNSIRFKTSYDNAEFHLDSSKAKVVDSISSVYSGNIQHWLLLKNQTYRADGAEQSKEAWNIDDLGYIRFKEAGSVNHQKLDIILSLDQVSFQKWQGTAKNKHEKNNTGEWLVFGEFLGNNINFSHSDGAYNTATKNRNFWFGELDIAVTTKVVYSGTDTLVDGEQFLQVVADMDINHSKNSSSNTIGSYSVEGFKTVSGFTGDYYTYDTATWLKEFSSQGVMHFYANPSNEKLSGQASYTKGAVYALTEGAEFQSVYQEGNCGANYAVYLMHTPDINLTKTTDTSHKYTPGEKVTYEITLKMGTWFVDTFSTYPNLAITDQFPEGLTFVSATIRSDDTSAGTHQNEGMKQAYIFDEEWLKDTSHYDGKTYTLVVVAKVKEDVSAGTKISNTAKATIKMKDGKDTEITAKDSAEIEVRDFKVTHQFKSGTPGKTLPNEIVNRVPADQENKKNGTEVQPSDFDHSDLKVSGGTWKFQSWDAESKTIEGADQEFIGTWVFVSDEDTTVTYDVTHEFVSGTEGKELPEEVKKLTPADQKEKADGSTVAPSEFATKEVVVEDGTWKFVKWDAESKTIEGADQHFVGTWVFEEKTYKVTHEFVSGTEGKELPEEVKKLLPEDQMDKKNGSTVTPSAFTPEEVKVEGGTWKFVDWDEDSKTIDRADQHFVGKWVFEEEEAPGTDPSEEPDPGNDPGTEPDPGNDPGSDPGTEPENPKPTVDPGTDPSAEPDKPQKPGKTDSPEKTTKVKKSKEVAPDTGDDSNLVLWGMISIFSMAGVLLSVRMRRRKS